ncbi:hypothetical protein [uncultured Kordia sp.]|uniref:hypothetical protein n=1 Tax=uncultured Kordia sp. TaxID=507699 RepID=UPI002619EA9F|nr:hypothetical protein [uncultured Kordia sp.]
MREKKKSLKLRKFKVASLDAFWLKGGTNSNPCNNTQQSGATQVACPTYEHTCPVPCDPDTRTLPMTQPGNPCTCQADSIDPNNNGSQNQATDTVCRP